MNEKAKKYDKDIDKKLKNREVEFNLFRADNANKVGCYQLATEKSNYWYYKNGYTGSYRLETYPAKFTIGLGFVESREDEPVRIWDKPIQDILRDHFGYIFESEVVEGHDEEWCRFPDGKRNDEIFKKDCMQAITYYRSGKWLEPQRNQFYQPYKHQYDCISSVAVAKQNGYNKYLIAMKPRGGKTPTSLWTARRVLNAKNIMILTYKPNDTRCEWGNFVKFHRDYDGYKFIVNNPNDIYEHTLDEAVENNIEKLVYFTSYQSLGVEKTLSTIKSINWDCIIVDEDHFGADKQNGRSLLDGFTTDFTLYVTGTPTLELARGEFDENNSFIYTYTDEQTYKLSGARGYENALKMEVYNLSLDEVVKEVIEKQKLSCTPSEFFEADNNNKFKFEDAVNQFITTLRYKVKTIDDIGKSPKLALIDKFGLSHMLWQMPSINSISAMKKLLQNSSCYRDTKIFAITGDLADVKVSRDIDNEIENAVSGGFTKSISLTVYKGTTGVTIKQWDSIFLLSGSGENTSDGYYQTVYRAGSPYDGKKVYRIFDFNYNRILKLPIYEAEIRASRNNTTIAKELPAILNAIDLYNYEGTEFIKVANEDKFLNQYYDGITESRLESELKLFTKYSCSDKFDVIDSSKQMVSHQLDTKIEREKLDNSTKKSKEEKDYERQLEKERQNFIDLIKASIRPAYVYNNGNLTADSYIKALKTIECRGYIRDFTGKSIGDKLFENIIESFSSSQFYDSFNKLIVLYYRDVRFENLFNGSIINSGRVSSSIIDEMLSKTSLQ